MFYISPITKQLTSYYANTVFDCCGGKIKEGVEIILWPYHGRKN